MCFSVYLYLLCVILCVVSFFGFVVFAVVIVGVCDVIRMLICCVVVGRLFLWWLRLGLFLRGVCVCLGCLFVIV